MPAYRHLEHLLSYHQPSASPRCTPFSSTGISPRFSSAWGILYSPGFVHSLMRSRVAPYATYVSVINGAFSRSFWASPVTPDATAGCGFLIASGLTSADSVCEAWYAVGEVVEIVRCAWRRDALFVRYDSQYPLWSWVVAVYL
jgi:hypothetical protein